MLNDSSSPHAVLARGAAVFLAARGLGRLVALVSQAVLARLLAPAAFGIFALGWPLSVSSKPRRLSADHAWTRRLSSPRPYC